MGSAYRDKIFDIALNTFEVTCYMFPLEGWEAELEQKKGVSKKEIRSVVHFNGAAEGKMIVAPTEDLLAAMAANMLGIENPDEKQKMGALCEVANIICGNSVPLFAHDDQICYIQPPSVSKNIENADEEMQGMKRESMQVFLDEGTVEISIYYSIQEEL